MSGPADSLPVDPTDHAALVAYACSVIDTLDDIDSIADLGGPLDSLANSVDEQRKVQAVLTAHLAGCDLAAIGRALSSDAPVSWRETWLRRQTPLGDADIVGLAALTGEEFERYARDPASLTGLVSMLAATAAEEAADICAVLAQHPPVQPVPDAIPADWLTS